MGLAIAIFRTVFKDISNTASSSKNDYAGDNYGTILKRSDDVMKKTPVSKFADLVQPVKKVKVEPLKRTALKQMPAPKNGVQKVDYIPNRNDEKADDTQNEEELDDIQKRLDNIKKKLRT